MRKQFFDFKMITIYVILFSAFIVCSLAGNRAISVFSEKNVNSVTVVIDAGHGGIDGGAVSCTGVYESRINLEIAQTLDDLMHLLGIQTVMIRDTDQSIHTEGDTIARKKVSDIRNRVSIVNSTPNALFISIHQNHFSDSQYKGAQVFYNDQEGSLVLANELQEGLRKYLNPQNKRQPKKISGVYLMEHINCAGVLIECGFLSNPQEEYLLRDHGYQKKLSGVIATVISQYLNT